MSRIEENVWIPLPGNNFITISFLQLTVQSLLYSLHDLQSNNQALNELPVIMQAQQLYLFHSKHHFGQLKLYEIIHNSILNFLPPTLSFHLQSHQHLQNNLHIKPKHTVLNGILFVTAYFCMHFLCFHMYHLISFELLHVKNNNVIIFHNPLGFVERSLWELCSCVYGDRHNILAFSIAQIHTV